MSTITLQDRRTARAAGIVERHELRQQGNGVWMVRDSVTGSGRWHTTTLRTCDCVDFRRTGLACKHMQAVQRAEAGPRCPTCGSPTEAQQLYVGGRGYSAFRVCGRNQEHKAVRL